MIDKPPRIALLIDAAGHPCYSFVAPHEEMRMLRPLFLGYDDRTAMVGQRTRAALEREKAMVLRSINCSAMGGLRIPARTGRAASRGSRLPEWAGPTTG